MAAGEFPEWDAYVQDVRDAIRGREVDYIGQFTQLTPAGDGSFKGLSPLREEKSASFYAYPDKGFYDFGSQQGGDLITLVRERERCTYREALDILARFAGLDDWETRKKNRNAPAADPAALAAYAEEECTRTRIFAASTWLLRLCHEKLPSSVRAYLTSHYGYSSSFIEAQKIGWCPDDLWELARAPGEPRPFTDEEILATGWFVPHGEGAFAVLGGRIVFPYWQRGQARYAIGREHLGAAKKGDVDPAWNKDHAWDIGKYKKLPVRSEKKTWISPYVRNDVLWGEDTLVHMRDGTLYVAEGVTDAGALAMLGFPVISPVTVSFRNEDVARVLAILVKYRVKRVVILNDNDTTPDGKHPGLDGARRMAVGLWQAAVQVFIARLPRPEGASKIDANEVIVNALNEGDARGLAGGEWSDEAIAHARAVVLDIAAKAEVYPEFLANETPSDTDATALEPLLAELGGLSATMTPIAGGELLLKVLARFKKLPKPPARKVFYAAAAKAKADLERDAAAIASGEAAAGEAPAEGGAAAAEGSTSKPARKRASAIRGTVLVHPDGYYERESAAGARERISNFRLTAVKRIAHERGGPEWHCVRVDGVDTAWDAQAGHPVVLAAEWAVPPKAWVTKHSFFGGLPSSRMVWTGSDDDTKGVLELLTDKHHDVPLIRATGVLGRHVAPDGSLRFVLPAGTLGPDGQWMVDPDLAYLPDGGSNLQHRLPTAQADLASPETRALAKEFFEQILLLHDPRHMAALASWSMATLFAPFLRSKVGSFPILHVYATPSSGKTTLLHRIVWPAFTGVLRGELLACTSSAFSYARDFASSNALALFLDEFKHDIGPKQIELILRLVRRLYTGDTETRGRADQDLNLYYQQAPLGVCGEMRFEGDQAVNERIIVVGLNANYLNAHPEAKARYYALSQKPLASIAPLLQSWSVTADAEAMYARAAALLPKMLGELKRPDLPERVRHNVTALLFGAVALDACAASFGTAVADVPLPAFVDRVVGEIFHEEEGERGTGAVRVRDYLDEFLCLASIAANRGVVVEGKDYVWVDGMLRLWVAGTMAALAEWLRGQGQPMTIPHWRAVVRIARERLTSGESYVTRIGVDTLLGDERRAKCIEIDFNKVPESLGAESFPAFKEKHWGKLDWAATARARTGEKDKD